jgi:hypothetical protein
MAGVEKTLGALESVSEVVKGVQLVLEDGKVTLLDLRQAPGIFSAIKGLVAAAPAVKEELKDLDKEELEKVLSAVIDLALQVAEEFKLTA